MSWFNDGMSVLERDEQLAALRQAMDAATTSGGSLVLVSGEAGVGKTTLVRRFAATLEDARVVTGVCDPLPTPSPLGPLLDMAPGLGLPLEHLLAASSSSRDVAAAVLQRLASPAVPMLLVFEDVHWADQATLELIGFLGRRVERLRALIVATLRGSSPRLACPWPARCPPWGRSPGASCTREETLSSTTSHCQARTNQDSRLGHPGPPTAHPPRSRRTRHRRQAGFGYRPTPPRTSRPVLDNRASMATTNESIGRQDHRCQSCCPRHRPLGDEVRKER